MVEGGGTMSLRHNDPQFLKRVDIWWDELLPQLQRFLHINGGRVLMVQVQSSAVGPWLEGCVAHVPWHSVLLTSAQNPCTRLRACHHLQSCDSVAGMHTAVISPLRRATG